MTDLNLNNTECLVEKSHLGYDTFYNICTGVSTSVDWTALDWFGTTLVVLLAILVTAFVGAGIYMVVTDR